MYTSGWIPKTIGLLFVIALPSITQVGPSPYTNFEGALTNPVRISADGKTLYCVNNPNSTLSVFSLANPASPSLTAEIPVGVEPVSVNPRTTDEVWVVNQESDTVSIVSVSKRIVTDTINVKDEPMDVVFAGTNAFVSVGRSNLINVYDVTSHHLVKSIPVFGGSPRYLTVSNDGSLVYASFTYSGNGTTALPYQFAPPPPPPTNSALPPAPQQDIIIQWNDPAYSSHIPFSIPDNDVVAISTSQLAVYKYFQTAGTILFGLAVAPNGDVWVANTDALNTVRFEPNVQGHFVNNRLSKIAVSNGAVTSYDLNPYMTGVSTVSAPNSTFLSQALAQPTAVVFDGSGQSMWVAAFGTDRVAQVALNGKILSRIEINPNETGATVNPASKKGPRGLAINTAANKLYVHNRISNTLSVVDTATKTVLTEIPTGTQDPTPPVITAGRGFLYDAKLSGSGTGSCAGCHVDAEFDVMAWDLGDPGGTLTPVNVANYPGGTYQLHPMKGPMVTLTLRGMPNTAPFHWRGDKPNFNAFNVAFQSLMGGNVPSDSDMTAYTNFINTVLFMPNPYQNLDRSLSTSLTLPGGVGVGNAVNGEGLFHTLPVGSGNPPQTCNACHTDSNGFGSNLNVILFPQETQPFKNTLLRNSYQKNDFNNSKTETIQGFGLSSEGDVGNLYQFLSSKLKFPGLNGTGTNPQNKLDVMAYNISFDTGTGPTVGYARTATPANISTDATITSDWATLESRAGKDCDLIGQGTINGTVAGLLYVPNNANYSTTLAGVGPLSHAQVLQLITKGDTITLMGVPIGSGSRMSALSR